MHVDSLTIERMRTRPAMYIGSTDDAFGFMNYLICAYGQLLRHGATEIHLVADNPYIFRSNPVLPLDVIDLHLDNQIIIAFSSRFIFRDATTFTGYQNGQKLELQYPPAATAGVTIEMHPDSQIFHCNPPSLAIIKSYVRRLSYFHPQVRFSVESGGEVTTFSSPKGILDLFDSATAPFQLLMEPIHLTGQEADLQIELAFAFHSWFERPSRRSLTEGGSKEEHMKGGYDRPLMAFAKRCSRNVFATTILNSTSPRSRAISRSLS